MSGYVIDEIVAQNGTDLAVGGVVSSGGAWQEHSLGPATAVRRTDARGPLAHHLSVYGATGSRRNFGMLRISRPVAGKRSWCRRPWA